MALGIKDDIVVQYHNTEVNIPQICICQFSIEVRVSEPKLFSASDAIIIQG